MTFSGIYRAEHIPAYSRRKFILTGYRNPNSSLLQCIRSAFLLHNETFNFWTHFLPFFYFIDVLKTFLDSYDCFNDAYLWPFVSYVSACAFYTLTSSVAHLFCALSENAEDICFLMDYAAISLYALNAAIAYRAYAFPLQLRHTVFGEMTLNIAVAIAIFGNIIACHTRARKETTSLLLLRTLALGLPCVYAVGPVIYRVIVEVDSPSWTPHVYGITLMFLSGILYSARVPERFFPGYFDIICQSHQLFHLSSAIGTATQMRGIIIDLEERQELLRRFWEFTRIDHSIGIVSFVLLVNLSVVLFYGYRICRCRKQKQS